VAEPGDGTLEAREIEDAMVYVDNNNIMKNTENGVYDGCIM